jgi:hypothetical protein
LVLGPRAVGRRPGVLGRGIACSHFTDLVVFRPSSVASVLSRIAHVQDSAIVQQPKDPPVCQSACLQCLHHIALDSTALLCSLVHNHLPACLRELLACPTLQAYTDTINLLCHLDHPSPSLSPALHMHTPQQQADPSTLLSTLRSSSATALVPLDHGALLLFPRHRSCTLPNLAPWPSPTLPSTGLRSRDPGMRSGKRHVSFAEDTVSKQTCNTRRVAPAAA